MLLLLIAKSDRRGEKIGVNSRRKKNARRVERVGTFGKCHFGGDRTSILTGNRDIGDIREQRKGERWSNGLDGRSPALALGRPFLRPCAWSTSMEYLREREINGCELWRKYRLLIYYCITKRKNCRSLRGKSLLGRLAANFGALGMGLKLQLIFARSGLNCWRGWIFENGNIGGNLREFWMGFYYDKCVLDILDWKNIFLGGKIWNISFIQLAVVIVEANQRLFLSIR